MPNKPKQNYAVGDKEFSERDDCQTPPYALGPILPYLHRSWTVWEPCAGKGRLADELEKHVAKVIRTDIGDGKDFLDYEPSEHYDAIVTNPPFSKKFKMIDRCYALGKPWALLLPVETLGAGAKAHPSFQKYWIEPILLDKRVDFEMPEAGFSGGGAQFPSFWLCWKMTGQPGRVLFAKLDKPSKRKIKEPRVLLEIPEKNKLPGVATHQVDIYEMIEILGGTA